MVNLRGNAVCNFIESNNNLHDAEILEFYICKNSELHIKLQVHEYVVSNQSVVSNRFVLDIEEFSSEQQLKSIDFIGYGVFRFVLNMKKKSIILSSSVSGFEGKFSDIRLSSA